MFADSKRQQLTICVVGVANFCSALSVSIQAPFYPREAEKKGATPSQYGFVFGAYELVVFLLSIVFGKIVPHIGEKFMITAGIFVCGFTCILFGFVDKIEGETEFLVCSFAIRIIEATGQAAFFIASYTILLKEFPNNISGAFALLATCFTAGNAIGPAIGGALYEAGGFMVPFAVVGNIMLCTAILLLLLLPSSEDRSLDVHSSKGIYYLLLMPPIWLFSVTIFSSTLSLGFMQAVLEPHLRTMDIPAVQVYFLFMLLGATEAITAPAWGKLLDHMSPKSVCIIGSAFICLAFILIGPAPFLPQQMTITQCIIGLIAHGLGVGSIAIATFVGLHRDSIARGLPDDIGTHGHLCRIWNSSYSLCLFVGPSLSGVLFNAVGFSWASVVVVGLQVMLILITTAYILFHEKVTTSKTVSSEDREKQQMVIIHKENCDSVASYGTPN